MQNGKLTDASYWQLSWVFSSNEMPCDLTSGLAALEFFAGKLKGRVVKWQTSYLDESV